MRIKDAVLHDVIFIPGLGQLKTTLNQNSYKGIEMELIAGVLQLSHQGVIAIIPLSNFKVLTLDVPADTKSK